MTSASPHLSTSRDAASQDAGWSGGGWSGGGWSGGGWPHRLAVLLVCVVFPLIWVGGLVTSYNAGMAVPDWPNTYGYNLFLYPWTTWFFGPWDLFIEHGHRLLGALAGLVTIALVIGVFRSRAPQSVRWGVLAALALVIAQGALGGARVLLNDRQLAMIHGCTGPLFFAWCVGLAVVTSRWWNLDRRGASSCDRRDSMKRLAIATWAVAYGQLVLGAQLRHAQVTLDPHAFRVLVFAHLAGAAVLSLHVGWLLWRAIVERRKEIRIFRPAIALATLVVTQLALGTGTWIVNYAWPEWSRWGGRGAGYTIEAEGWLQANVVTAHVAVGSLILGVAAQLALRAWKLAPVGAAVPVGAAAFVGGAMWKGAAA